MPSDDQPIDVWELEPEEREEALGVMRAGLAALAEGLTEEERQEFLRSRIDLKLEGVYTRHGTHDQSSHGNWSVSPGFRRSSDGSPGEAVRELAGSAPEPDDGFSVNVSTGESPDTGFMVGGEGPEVAVGRNEDEAEAIQRYIEENREALSGDDVHLGGWRRPRDMSLVLDASKRLDSEEETARLAIERGEDAVFDIDSLEVIPTDELLS